ncbi:hypothetical protein HRJ35_21215 [Shewanella oneidensis MR-1]|nr:hypothetical protein [Shewanella oneidensis]MDX5998684.1 hypothetical protein [Shewanella oneidensis]MEE2028414.1 hypothetical protein [Shewanella oneidensis]QKG98276.1 hypothetical protein HRJ35_21215 [Shewanella oneidensis MR-1]
MNNILEDKKSNCLSILETLTVDKYLSLIDEAYRNKGGINGQRMPLKTKTAQKIRSRMVDDISLGAILPPMVVGLIVTQAEYERLSSGEEKITNLINHNISLIDGMQRTTAIKESLEKNREIINSKVRVEFWISHSMNSLIYRMLVLNTGQVPWDIKRQLDTIYEPIAQKLKDDMPTLDLRVLDDPKKRTSSSQYQSSKLIEYYLCFTTRKVDVDLKDKVSEDFARLDTIAAASESQSLDIFSLVIKRMLEIDDEISRLKDISSGRFKSGKDLFTSIPVGAGFVSAAAEYIYGVKGLDCNEINVSDNLTDFDGRLVNFVAKLKEMDDSQLEEFLEFDLLNEKLSVKSSKIGTFEREFFYKSFEALFKYSDQMPNFQVCWLAR